MHRRLARWSLEIWMWLPVAAIALALAIANHSGWVASIAGVYVAFYVGMHVWGKHIRAEIRAGLARDPNYMRVVYRRNDQSAAALGKVIAAGSLGLCVIVLVATVVLVVQRLA